MHTGQGTLVLRNGRKLPLLYKFGVDHGDTRAGYLLCDMSSVDPATLCDGTLVVCDDGTHVIVGVIQSGDRFHIVSGRVARATAA